MAIFWLFQTVIITISFKQENKHIYFKIYAFNVSTTLITHLQQTDKKYGHLLDIGFNQKLTLYFPISHDHSVIAMDARLL